MNSVIRRRCACAPDCAAQFDVPQRQPGRKYAYGHAPTFSKTAAVKVEAPKERSMLDYQIALKTATRDLDAIVDQIDQTDDAIAKLREQIRALEQTKEGLTSRHARLYRAKAYIAGVIENVDVQEVQ